jgi:hypothetical protein
VNSSGYFGACPDGSTPVNCLVNPCQFASCPAVAGATCVADYCGGCNARWILNGLEVTHQCEGCSDGSQPVNCLVDPCQTATCPSVNGATCVANYCGGCNAQWFLNGHDVTEQCQGCSDGSVPVNCLVNPCDTATCPAINGATCVADYCGGCNARWLQNGDDVTNQCQGCQDGSRPVRCKVNPCQGSSCPAVAGATCVADYCGGCNAHWVLNGQEVTDRCQGACPDGSSPVNCLVIPCQFASCPAVAGATCVADYCGGCNARWILNGLEVTHQCQGCPGGSLPVNCLIDPCQVNTCPSLPTASCVADYCGGCNARFFINDVEVTHACCKSFSFSTFNVS